MRLFTSNGTAPDTGASNDSVILGVSSAGTIVPDVLVTAVHAAQGMYYVELSQSNVSVLGLHPLYHTQGDFPQHVATVEVVNYNPMSRSSAFTSADSVGLKAATHSGATIGVGSIAPAVYSGVTVGINDAVGDMSSKFTVGAGIAAPSLVTVQVSGGTVAGVTNKVDLRAGVYSDISLRLDANAVPAGAFQADSIDAIALAAMNLSDVTVRVHPMTYSGMTVGVNDLAGTFSAATVRVSGGTVTGVTNMVQSNVSQIDSVRVLAQVLASHVSSVVTGQASAGSLAVNAMTADVPETTNDHFNGRVILFTGGALHGQATSINTSGGYIGFSNGSSRFHFPSLTEAPTAGDNFIIV